MGLSYIPTIPINGFVFFQKLKNNKVTQQKTRIQLFFQPIQNHETIK
jgi:hypothetical protein